MDGVAALAVILLLLSKKSGKLSCCQGYSYLYTGCMLLLELLILTSFQATSIKAWQIPYQKLIKSSGSLGGKDQKAGKMRCEDSDCYLDISLEGRLMLKTGHSIRFDYTNDEGLTKTGRLYVKDSKTILTYGPEVTMPAYNIAHDSPFSSEPDYKEWDNRDLYDDNDVFNKMGIGKNKNGIKGKHYKTYTTYIENKTLSDLSDKFKCGGFLREDIKMRQILSVIPLAETGHIQYISYSDSVLNITLCVDVGVEVCEVFVTSTNENIEFVSEDFKIRVNKNVRPKRPVTPTLVARYNRNDGKYKLSNWKISSNSYRGNTVKGTLGAVQSTCLYTGEDDCKPGVFDLSDSIDWTLNTWRQCAITNNTLQEDGPVAVIVGIGILIVGLIGVGVGVAYAESNCMHCGFTMTGVNGPIYQYELAERLRNADEMFLNLEKKFPTYVDLVRKRGLVYPGNIKVEFHDYEDSFSDIEFNAEELKFKIQKPKGKVEKFSIPFCNITISGGVSSCLIQIQFDGSDQVIPVWTDQTNTIVVTPAVSVSHGSNKLWVGIQNIQEGSWTPKICIGSRIAHACLEADEVNIIVGPDITTLIQDKETTDKQSKGAWDFKGFWEMLSKWYEKLIATIIWLLSVILLIIFIVMAVRLVRLWGLLAMMPCCNAAMWKECPKEFIFKQGDKDNYTNISYTISEELLTNKYDETEFYNMYIVTSESYRVCKFKEPTKCIKGVDQKLKDGRDHHMCDNRATLRLDMADFKPTFKYKIQTAKWNDQSFDKYDYMDCWMTGKNVSFNSLPNVFNPVYAPYKDEITGSGPNRIWKSNRVDPNTPEYDQRNAYLNYRTFSEQDGTFCTDLMIPTIQEDFDELQGTRVMHGDGRLVSLAPMCLEDISLKTLDMIEENNVCYGEGSCHTRSVEQPTKIIFKKDDVKETNMDIYGVSCYRLKPEQFAVQTRKLLGPTWMSNSLIFNYKNTKTDEFVSRMFYSPKGFVIGSIKKETVVTQKVYPIFAYPQESKRVSWMMFGYLTLRAKGSVTFWEEYDSTWISRVREAYRPECKFNEKIEVSNVENMTIISWTGEQCSYRSTIYNTDIKIRKSIKVNLMTCLVDGISTLLPATADGPLSSDCICMSKTSVLCLDKNHVSRFLATCDTYEIIDGHSFYKYSGFHSCGEETVLDYDPKTGKVVSQHDSLISVHSSETKILRSGEILNERGRIRDMSKTGDFYYLGETASSCSDSKFQCLWQEHRDIMLLSFIMPSILLVLLISTCVIRVCIKARIKKGLVMGASVFTGAAESIINMTGARPSNKPAGFKYE